MEKAHNNSNVWQRRLIKCQEEYEKKVKKIREFHQAWTEKKKEYETMLYINDEEMSHLWGQVDNAVEKVEEAYQVIGE